MTGEVQDVPGDVAATHDRVAFVLPPTVRKVVVDGMDGRRHVVTHQSGLFAWLMPSEPLAGEWPAPVSLKRLNSELENGQPRYSLFVSTQVAAPVAKWQQDAGTARLEKLVDVLNDVERLKFPAGRSAAIKEMAAKLGMAKSSCWEILSRWLASGMLPAALVGDLRNPRTRAIDPAKAKLLDLEASIEACRSRSFSIMETPAKPVERVDYNRRSGLPRQRRQGGLTRYQCDDHAVRVIWEAVQKNSGPAVKVAQLMAWLRENVYFSINQAGQKVAFPADAMPSEREVLNWRLKLLPPSQRIKRERGSSWARKNAQPMLGSQIEETAPAGGEGQIDATIWNITILADTPEREPIGPAVVFRLRAKHGGMLLGLHVGLEAASWAEAACAIDCCLKSKVVLCSEHGIQIEHEEWPVIGLPAQIYADCGETYNSRPRSFIALTGIQIHNLPADSPNLKGGVEADFFVLQTDINGLTPAAIIKKYEDATKEKWVSRASMTIKEFTTLLLLSELRRMKQPKQRIKLSEILASVPGANTSSLGLWRALSSVNGTGLRDFSSMEGDVRVSLLARERGASVTEYGVLFRGLHYIPIQREHDEMFVKVRDGSRRTKLEVAFDHRLVDTIYIVPEDAKTRSDYIECTLNVALFGQASFLGKPFREVKDRLDRLKEENAEAMKAIEARDRDLEAQQRRIVETSTQKTGAARNAFPVSVKEQVKAIPAAREAEKARFSPTTALVPARAAPAPAPAPHAAVAPPTAAELDQRQAGFESDFPARVDLPAAPVSDANQAPAPASAGAGGAGSSQPPHAALPAAAPAASAPPAATPPEPSVAAARLASLQKRASSFNDPSTRT